MRNHVQSGVTHSPRLGLNQREAGALALALPERCA
ncbi:protein of unknown function [Streptomyces murinus]